MPDTYPLQDHEYPAPDPRGKPSTEFNPSGGIIHPVWAKETLRTSKEGYYGGYIEGKAYKMVGWSAFDELKD